MKKKIIIVSIILAVVILGTAVFFARGYLVTLFVGEKTAEESTENVPDQKEEETVYDTKTPFQVWIPAAGEEKPEGLYEISKKRLEEMADAPIVWKYMDGGHGQSVMKKNIGKGKYPEVVIGKVFTSSEIARYVSKGILLPIEDYINETDTPNIWKMFQERPAVRASNVALDGHIYTLPSVKEFMPDYMENVMWINKAWLDNLNLRVPRNLTELKNVLKAFKERDPNGNGIADEIPLTFLAENEESYPEVLLSSWGLATKYGSNDSWMTIQNGEVKFTPVMDEWKAMITYYRDLYREGLLDPDVFENDSEIFLEKQQTATSVVGVLWSNEKAMLHGDEYVAMPPLSANGRVKPVWRINSRHTGTRDVFCIFKNCKNPGAVMRWVDKFFAPEQSIRNAFGEAADNSTFSIKEDTFVWNELPVDMTFQDYVYQCILTGGMPCYLPRDLYGSEKLPMREEWTSRMEIYDKYKAYLDDEPWPRPYYTVEETERMDELYTDISILVKVKMEKWIIDGENLEKDWEQYKENLETMGAGELLKIYQDAYGRTQEDAINRQPKL